MEEGGSTTIRLAHSSHELRALPGKFPDLRPYFYATHGMQANKSCFGNNPAESMISKKGLCGDCPAFAPALQALLEEADHFYLHPATPRLPVKWTIVPSSLAAENTILKDIFLTHRFDGLCVGEVHHHQNPKKFIIDNLEAFKSMGGTTLFLEHIMYDTMQPLLDAYFASLSDEMPPVMEAYLTNLDAGQRTTAPYTFMALVRRAKAAGIRVVGIDTSLSYGAGYSTYDGRHGSDRMKAMNYVAQQIIKYEKGAGKYIALIGSSHGSSLLNEDRSTAGVAELLQCPFIVIEDSTNKTTHVEVNVSAFKGEVAHVHLYLAKPLPVP